MDFSNLIVSIISAVLSLACLLVCISKWVPQWASTHRRIGELENRVSQLQAENLDLKMGKLNEEWNEYFKNLWRSG